MEGPNLCHTTNSSEEVRELKKLENWQTTKSHRPDIEGINQEPGRRVKDNPEGGPPDGSDG